MHPPEASWAAFVILCLGDSIYAGAHRHETSILSPRLLLTIAHTFRYTRKWVGLYG